MAAKPTRQDAGRHGLSPLLTGESGQPVMRKSEDKETVGPDYAVPLPDRVLLAVVGITPPNS